MPGVDNGFGREGKDFFSDPIQQEFSVASRQVPSSHPVGKKDIATKKLIGLGQVEAETAWTVAGDMKKSGLRPTRWCRGGFVEKLGGANGPEFLGKAEGEHGIGLKAEKGGVGMIVNGALGPFGEVGSVPDVVPVTVGQEKGIGLELFLFQKVEEAFRGVDGQEMSVQIEKISVRVGKAACVSQRWIHWVFGSAG